MPWTASRDRARTPRSRTNIRGTLLRFAILLLAVILLSRLVFGGGQGGDRFRCTGPLQPAPGWRYEEDPRNSARHLLAQRSEQVVVDSPTIRSLVLGNKTTPRHVDRILILTPLRDAAAHLETHFKLLSELTYPHDKIDLAFLVGDCTDDTLAVLRNQLGMMQRETSQSRFRSAMIVEKDFGDVTGQSVEERHSFKAQGVRRRAIGRSRNYLLYTAFMPVHDWVYWRDVDIVENPPTILEDMMKHDKDILVPNIWFHRYDKDGKDIEGRYDYNSWQESWWGRRKRRALSKDVILAEGYKEYNMHRKTLNWMGDRHKDKDREVPLDGIGGVNILVKAEVHRSGVNFPCYAFENQADTEGFAAMAKAAGFQVYGLPNYIVWHIDTEEKEGNLKGRPADQEKDDKG